ncbi:hypothetical protein LY90DRAFT_500679 [Neocallimastix californiae]|uniref:KNTC1 first ARM-repeats domain-containing protein n=1 Tax=Neocallimastix californiae TaxID=1754190 RepID=A0A1Y2F6Y3_9FUNG|nr:hypothetical protein LY90DRAFT_500679 [Neocallimastix californiae]|eukprot:ORY79658.1 hypothetical protein LY90DRAFT_500679 [Neocallimastix californiae]
MDLINTVHIRSISEIIPANQFQYMINNKKYDEALNFAEKNNLDRQIVLKPKLKDQLERINSNLSSSEDSYNLQQILEDLSQIGDFNFGNNLTKGTLFNSKEWQTFKNSNIIEDIKQLFYHGKISLGIIIWRRHLIGKK